MAITSEQRKKRKRFLGSSEIAAVVGADPFRNIADVYLEKTEALEERNGTKATRMGQHLEGAILNMFEDAMDVKLKRDIWLDHGDFCANLDAAIIDDEELVISPVEAKSTRFIEMWGRNEDSNEAPVAVCVQVQWQLLLAGPQARRGYAPVFYPGYKDFGFECVTISRDDELIADLEWAGQQFMNAVKNRPSEKELQKLFDGAIPTLETIKRVKREPQSVISISEDSVPTVKKWREIKEKASFIKSDDEILKEKVLALLRNTEAGRLPDGAMLTYMEQNGARHCDVDLLEFKLGRLQDELERAKMMIKSANPGEALAILEALDGQALYQATVRQSRHRTLRYKKAPKIRG